MIAAGWMIAGSNLITLSRVPRVVRVLRGVRGGVHSNIPINTIAQIVHMILLEFIYTLSSTKNTTNFITYTSS